MDPRSFDRLVRRVGGLATRRGLLAALTAAFGPSAAHAGPTAAGCGKARQRCRRDKDCCNEFSCLNGRCACSNVEHNACGLRCFDLKTNDNNCGRCGRKCKGDLRCLAGTCRCPSGKDDQCGKRCVDLQADPKNCGACNAVCPGEYACNDAVCGCAEGLTECPGQECADLDTDPEHCGACGVECEGELSCLQGDCACAADACYVRSWTGAAGGEPLQGPWGVAARDDRNVLVADRQGDEIREFTPVGESLNAWTAVGVAWLAVDAADDAYATYPQLGRVEKYAGLPGGAPAWSVNSVPGPQGIAAVLSTAVYVAVGAGDQLYRLDAATGATEWAAGQFGTGDGDLSGPIGVAADLDGNAYVADAGNDRIAVFRPNGTFWRNLTGAGLANPHGLAIDGDLLYVADRGNERVAVLGLDGTPLASIATAGPLGALRDPVGVAVDRDGRLLVTDEDLRRVIVYEPGDGIASLTAAAKRARGGRDER